jgi:glyoxylase-like metal-dependent hydrolase (beta-lactamase superfamily II)
MQIKHFFNDATSTLTYVVFDEKSKDAVIIDPVLDFDPASGKIEDKSALQLMNFIKAGNLKIHYILETHAHADHLSSSHLIKQFLPGSKLAIGERIIEVQKIFKKIFNLARLKTDGSQFDALLEDGQTLQAGILRVDVIPTPGHTPACISYKIGDSIFVGDALFMPDYGTGRCDFPGGSARKLFHSIQKNIYTLPEETKIHIGHDYQPNGRDLVFQTTVAESKKNNIHLKEETTEEEFIHFREERDKTLRAPHLLLPSLQVNISAGHLPEKESNGISYLKLPLQVAISKGEL